jgi:polysaccharide export outer membrane protein
LYFVASVSLVLADGGRADQDAEDILAAGDRLTVTVFGQPELSGVYQVNGKGEIELPVVGEISVNQLTIKEAEKRTEERLTAGYVNHPVVSITISELRPIYVVGDVKAPGSFPYRHGAMVMNAVAQAGGYGSAEQLLPTTAYTDYLLAEERVQTMENNRLTLSIRKARLEAQLDNRATFEPPLLPVAGPQAKQMMAAIANERDALSDQTQELRQRLALLRDQKPRLETAATAVQKQIESEQKQLELVGDQLKDWAKLKEKGLGLRTTEVSLLREQAALDVLISGYRTELARLAVTMGDLDIKIQEAQAAEHRRIAVELQDVRTRLSEIDTVLPTVRQAREARLRRTAGGPEPNTQVNHRIVVRRMVQNAVQQLDATEQTLLKPGDIVEVIWLTPTSNTPNDNAMEARVQGQPYGLAARADSE